MVLKVMVHPGEETWQQKPETTGHIASAVSTQRGRLNDAQQEYLLFILS